tara:strand:- start:614 stop:3208 length:2595 start_codon:yes stop_codon:yes gene_type:complete
MATGIGVGIAGQVFQTKAGVGIGPDADCIDSCSVNFANVNGGAQTQWLSGTQGTAMTFGAGGIGDFSISFWIYPTNLSTGANMRIFDFGLGATTPPNGRLQIHINTSGTAMTTTLKVNDTATDPSGGVNLPFPQDTWTHITWTASRTATDVSGKWYANGVFVGNTDTDPFSQATNVVTTATTGPFYIGRSGATGMFEGNLDDFTIWDRALTAAEIVEIMGVSIDPTVCMNSLSFYDDLTHWWEMGDPQGDVSYPIIPDAIGTIDMEMKGMSASNIDCSLSPSGLYTYIPDLNFQAKLILSYGVTFPMPNYCLTSDINTITNLDVSSQNIANLTGIEDFTALTQLQCQSNQLTSLDVSNNTALTFLNCYYNQLTSLITTGLASLDSLNCHNNNLTSLDVSTNTALYTLFCYFNQLSSLDVSTNTALYNLRCFNNQLSSLDVSNNTALYYLFCDSNQLSTLDVSNNTALYYLYCDDNQLTSLDVSGATALTYLFCYSNQLTSLDVSTNTALTSLRCDGNQLTILDVSNNTALTGLLCQDNNLHSLDVRNGNNTAIPTANFNATGNTNLICIEVDNVAWSDTNWTNIDSGASFSLLCLMTYIPDAAFRTKLIAAYGVVFPLTEYAWTSDVNTLTNIAISSLNISDLTGIEDFTLLNYLNCTDNNLTTLDASYNTALDQLHCYNNQLTSVDVSTNTALTILNCGVNQLTSLDVSNNTALTNLQFNVNQLTSIDVSTNTALERLILGNNQLTSLNVSANTALYFLECQYNQLTSLNVSSNTVLEDLECGNNQLTTLDISNNPAIWYFECQDNQLTSLDMRNGNNTILTTNNFIATTNLFTCISVSDTVWANANWIVVDAGVTFSLSFPC